MADEHTDPAGSWAPPTPVENWNPYVSPPPAADGSGAYVVPPLPSPWQPAPERHWLIGLLIGLGVLVFIAAPAIAIAFLLNSVNPSQSPAQSQPTPEFTPRDSTAPPPTAPIGLSGDTLTTEHGISITVQTPSCYSYQAGAPGEAARKCSVPIEVANDSLEQVRISSADFDLFIGDTGYAPISEESQFFGVPRQSRLDPAQGGLVLLWFDVPLEGEPTSLVFQRYNASDTALTVDFLPAPTTIDHPDAPGSESGPIGSTLYADPTFHNAPGFMAVTVLAVECGFTEAPDDGGALEPDGEFCRVTANVGNETDHAQKVSGADFALLAGGSTFSTSSPANRFDGQRRSDFMEPGEVDECILWFDLPPGTTPSTVRYVTYGGSTVTFTVG